MRCIVISGKRGVGKDRFARELLQVLPNAVIQSLANTFKRIFAREQGLDADRLISDRAYKEQHRAAMNASFEQFHREQPLLCCREALQVDSSFDWLIIPDMRLQSDIDACREMADIITVRIEASDEVRQRFGWRYDANIDQHWTETDLDYAAFDYVIVNDGTPECLCRAVNFMLLCPKPGPNWRLV